MDQIGSEDLSTSIDTILEKTGQSKLTYIGHSMGTTVSYILLASKPEYNEKINLLVSLARAAYFQSESFYLNTMILAILVSIYGLFDKNISYLMHCIKFLSPKIFYSRLQINRNVTSISCYSRTRKNCLCRF